MQPNRSILWLTFLCLTSSLLSQNLVPNCDFSRVITCPTDHSQFDLAREWFTPGNGTTDLCHECNGHNASIPQNMWGNQYPYSGIGYGHIICYYPLQGIDYREYMSVELPCALVGGEQYNISFYISCSDLSKYAIDRISLAFSEVKPVQQGSGVIQEGMVIAVESPTGVPISDKSNWQRISAFYTASGGENYLTIGCFERDEQLEVYTFPNITGRYASYYIDQVTVEGNHVHLDLGNDTILCQGEELHLDASLYCADSYLWNDGLEMPQRVVVEPGYYSVTVAIGCGSITDAIQVNYYPQTSTLLPDDTILCPGFPVTLDAGEGFVSYSWQDDSQEQTYSASTPGSYWVEVVDANGCMHRDSIKVNMYDQPVAYLGDDTIICLDDSLVIDLVGIDHYAQYLWMGQVEGSSFTIREKGYYWLQVQTPCGIIEEDILVEMQNCKPEVWIPTAFTPNMDGLNDIFSPRGINIDEYRMVILDRWGKKIYESSDLQKGWDGTYRGKPCDPGLYVYLINFTSNSNEQPVSDILSGQLVLIRP